MAHVLSYCHVLLVGVLVSFLFNFPCNGEMGRGTGMGVTVRNRTLYGRDVTGYSGYRGEGGGGSMRNNALYSTEYSSYIDNITTHPVL